MGAALVLLLVGLGALAAGVLIGRYYVPDDRQLRRTARHSRAYMRALSHLIARDHDTVVSELRGVVEENVDDVEPYFALGAVFRSRGEHERAIRVHQALAMRERDRRKLRQRAMYELGLDFRAAGMPRRATRALEEVLLEEPGHPGALRVLAALYEEQARFNEAAGLWQRMGRRGGEAGVRREHHLLVAAAQAALGRDDLDSAKQLLKAAQKLQESAHFFAAAAELAAARNNHRGAKERLQQALIAEPALAPHLLPGLIAAERELVAREPDDNTRLDDDDLDDELAADAPLLEAGLLPQLAARSLPQLAAASPELAASPSDLSAASPRQSAASGELAASLSDLSAASPGQPGASGELAGSRSDLSATSPGQPAASAELAGSPLDLAAVSPRQPATSPELTTGSPLDLSAAAPRQPGASAAFAGSPSDLSASSSRQPGASAALAGSPLDLSASSPRQPAASAELAGSPLDRSAASPRQPAAASSKLAVGSPADLSAASSASAAGSPPQAGAAVVAEFTAAPRLTPAPDVDRATGTPARPAVARPASAITAAARPAPAAAPPAASQAPAPVTTTMQPAPHSAGDPAPAVPPAVVAGVLAVLAEVEAHAGPRLELALIRAQLLPPGDAVGRAELARRLAAQFPDALAAHVATARLALASSEPTVVRAALDRLVSDTGALAWALRGRWQCAHCGHRPGPFSWRCGQCRRWSTLRMETGVEPPPAPPRERRAAPRVARPDGLLGVSPDGALPAATLDPGLSDIELATAGRRRSLLGRVGGWVSGVLRRDAS